MSQGLVDWDIALPRIPEGPAGSRDAHDLNGIQSSMDHSPSVLPTQRAYSFLGLGFQSEMLSTDMGTA